MEKRNFTLLGGDQRNIALANLLLEEDENDVLIYGFDKLDLHLNNCNNLDEALRDADIIVGPLPMSKDNETLNTPLFSEKIYLKDILNHMSSNQILVAGMIDNEFLIKIRARGIQAEDYYAREEMQILNAVPTAEGAIQIAMEEMKTTLHNSNAMVLGYGRIGKVLSKMLQGIGANVFVEARKYSDLDWIKTYGYTAIHLKKLDSFINNMDVIFNTIPSNILDESLLRKINEDCIIIELASNPGGFNFSKAVELDVNSIMASGLPGKVAPNTAASIIKDTIFNIINEREE